MLAQLALLRLLLLLLHRPLLLPPVLPLLIIPCCYEFNVQHTQTHKLSSTDYDQCESTAQIALPFLPVLLLLLFDY